MPDFNPTIQRQTHTQCWVRILGLLQECWRPKIIFAIAGGIGTPVAIDEVTSKKSFGHFARVLVDLDLNSRFQDQILVEREGYAFFVGLVYENPPLFCTHCQVIGHDSINCRKKSNPKNTKEGTKGKPSKSVTRKQYIPKAQPQLENMETEQPVERGPDTTDSGKENPVTPNETMARDPTVVGIEFEPYQQPPQQNGSAPHFAHTPARLHSRGARRALMFPDLADLAARAIRYRYQPYRFVCAKFSGIHRRSNLLNPRNHHGKGPPNPYPE